MLDSTVGQGSPTASVILALQIANPFSRALSVFLTYLVENATLQDTVFFSRQTPLPVASEWTILAEHGTLWHPCLPLGYRGLEQVFLLFLNHFSSFPFEINLWKSTTIDDLKSTFSLLFFFILEKKNPGSIFWRRAPFLQVLHAPSLPRLQSFRMVKVTQGHL